MIIGYAITLTLAVGLLIAYFTIIKKRIFWLGLLYTCVAVINLGYLILSLSKTVELAIFGNDLAYLGSVFLSMCMLFVIMQLCGFSIRFVHVCVCVSLGVIMFAIVALSPLLPWYYKEVSIESVGQATKLVKVYGFMHPVYLVYLLSYFVAMIVTIIHSLMKKTVSTQKFAGLMAGVVCGNLLAWVFEKFVSWNFEFLTITYILSEIVLLMVYWMMQDYIHVSDLPPITFEEKTPIIVVDSLTKAEKIKTIISRLPDGTNLSARQMDILEGILDGKSRKEMAADLHLSENTVKMHTSSLYRQLDVSSRDEIFALLKM